MADGLNDARAMRVAEVMNDFRTLQHYIMQLQTNTPASDYYEEGYTILRQCHAEAQAVLAAHFNESQQVPGSAGEQQRRQLQRVLIDASARRFQCQKILLRATAAIRWANTRNAILQGQRPHAGHTAALQHAASTMRAELNAITNERVVDDLRLKDWQAGHWLDEDPPLPTILNWIRSQH
ncbi:hypothetical protein MMC24_001858 [Lignoscripta atroalba]|nr:hypothetical protein [Lignoscripta atroalba]